MRKRNHTVTIRMNKEEYELLQSKVKESGRTQQEVVIKAIADLKIASTEEVEELKRLNQLFADILSQLRGATTNINQIARKLHTDGEVPNDSIIRLVLQFYIDRHDHKYDHALRCYPHSFFLRILDRQESDNSCGIRKLKLHGCCKQYGSYGAGDIFDKFYGFLSFHFTISNL